LAQLKGGDLRNAIPREAKATIVIGNEFENDFRNFVSRFTDVIKAELKHTEPDLSIEIRTVDRPEQVLTEKEAERLVGML
jgi:dipeptidase D